MLLCRSWYIVIERERVRHTFSESIPKGKVSDGGRDEWRRVGDRALNERVRRGTSSWSEAALASDWL